MKRNSNILSPTRYSQTEKDQRRMEQTDSMVSIALGTSTASGMSEATRKRLDREKDFENRGKGPMRNMVVVDMLKCDSDNFKGTITPTEVKNVIYKETLNHDELNLHGIKVKYKGNPVISFMLKEKINIDTTFPSVHFYFEKDTANGRSMFEGKIRGVRLEDSTLQENDVRWVKLENCAWAWKRLVEEVKERSGAQGVNPSTNPVEMETGGKEGGEEKERKETTGLRRSGRVDGKKGENNRTPTQTRLEGIGLGEPGNGKAQKTTCLEIQSKIAAICDEGKCAAMSSLNLSAAFNVVNRHC